MLKCPGCARTKFINQWPQHWTNNSLDIATVLKFLDIDLHEKLITLSGVYGDPIYHPQFVEFVKQIKSRGAALRIVTNGSYKKQSWWTEMVQYLTNQDTVVFSVDGIPENFTQYRINGDWNSIKTGMEACVNARCITHWKFIPFAYNQHTISQAQVLSNQIGIDAFIITPSDRYDAETMHFKPTDDLVGDQFDRQQLWKSSLSMEKLNPKCAGNQEHFISAQGYYSPCAFLADHRFYYKTRFGKNKKHYDIKDRTLTEILSQEETVNFFQTLDQHSCCQFNCTT